MHGWFFLSQIGGLVPSPRRERVCGSNELTQYKAVKTFLLSNGWRQNGKVSRTQIALVSEGSVPKPTHQPDFYNFMGSFTYVNLWERSFMAPFSSLSKRATTNQLQLERMIRHLFFLRSALLPDFAPL